MDFIEDLVRGKNSLLFAYGVTSSGKTYTMTGKDDTPGILPRSADVLFNSITELANRCTFYPNGRNGFGIRTEAQAYAEQIKTPQMEIDFNKRIREIRKVEIFFFIK